jgi:hypothetical protein
MMASRSSDRKIGLVFGDVDREKSMIGMEVKFLVMVAVVVDLFRRLELAIALRSCIEVDWKNRYHSHFFRPPILD